VRTSRPNILSARGPDSLVRRVARHWQTFLVAGYTVAALSWTMPAVLFPQKAAIDGFVRGPFLLLGLWQAWDMFSPDPRTDDICVELRYTDSNGTAVGMVRQLGEFQRLPIPDLFLTPLMSQVFTYGTLAFELG